MKLNSPDPEALAEHRKNWEAMKSISTSRRSQEEIIAELSQIIKDYDRELFLPFLRELTNHIDQRESSSLYENLMSPLRQFGYLTDLFLSVETGGGEMVSSHEEWFRVTSLLNEMVMTYLGEIGYRKLERSSPESLEKVYVSLSTFMSYYGNGQLSYDEQTLERLEKNCGIFNDEVKEYFGFSVTEAVTFSHHIRNLINKKFTDCNFFFLNKNEWEKLTTRFIERGVINPEDWWNEPELELFKQYKSKPGLIFIHTIDDLYRVEISKKAIGNMIDFLFYKDEPVRGQTVYYADKSPLSETPIVKLNDREFLCPQFKFLLESFYNRINFHLANKKGDKYTHLKNLRLEKKVAEIFRKLFGRDALIIESYYVDDKKSEQDLIILWKGFYFIIEVKDTRFRAPMRNPIKAFNKIKSDFKRAIQYGYDQCLRVEKRFDSEEPFEIFDSKTKKSRYRVLPRTVRDYFSIIVTQYKFANIQTNLENLLRKEEDALYPWSVCVDDLEAFVLALLKLKKGMAKTLFIDFLRSRECYHEHLICGDELELCGFFINSPKTFHKLSSIEETICTDPRMSNLFDAEYENGLGFENEIDIKKKRKIKTNNYQKKWDFNVLSGDDLNGK